MRREHAKALAQAPSLLNNTKGKCKVDSPQTCFYANLHTKQTCISEADGTKTSGLQVEFCLVTQKGNSAWRDGLENRTEA